MKKLIVLIVLCCGATVLFAQQNPDMVDMKKHRIVMQFTDGDSLSQAIITAQVKNIRTAWPNAEVEVVCHGPGLDLLLTTKSKASSALSDLSSKGVIFSACNNTMRRRNLKKEDLLSTVRIVPSAMIQLTLRQEEGWAFVKGGQ